MLVCERVEISTVYESYSKQGQVNMYGWAVMRNTLATAMNGKIADLL